MIAGIRIKVCGLTTLAGVRFAHASGADYIGFNLYPKSPRFIPLAEAVQLIAQLPDLKTVAVMVSPTVEELAAANTAGFDFFQIHFPIDTPVAAVAAWVVEVGRARLWLAPKLPVEQDLPASLLSLADTFLFDTFHAQGFGGSGRTGDWGKFLRHQQSHPEKTWILAGGLNPENVGAAIRQSGAAFLDVNSGVESAPGVKDQGKLRQLAEALHGIRG